MSIAALALGLIGELKFLVWFLSPPPPSVGTGRGKEQTSVVLHRNEGGVGKSGAPPGSPYVLSVLVQLLYGHY